MELYYQLIGNSFEYVFKEFKKQAGIEVSLSNYKNIFNQIYLEKLNHNIKIGNCVHDFLEKIYVNNINIALVTSSEMWAMNLIINKVEIKKYFKVLISGDDVIHKKPDPEPYQKAIKYLKVKKTFVFEDTEPGIISANRAGAYTFGIKNKYNSINDLKQSQRIYNSFEEVDLGDIIFLSKNSAKK